MGKESKAGPRLASLSAVFPAHDEEENLERTIEEWLPALKAAARDLELIIVDDGSRDRTGEIASRLASRHSGLKAVRHSRNLGYGAALASGFKAAAKEWIFFTDADGQFFPEDLEKLIEPALESGFAAGRRESRADPLHRVIYGRLFSLLVRRWFGVSSRDVNCAFKLFRREVVEGHEFMSKGALVNTELFLVAARKGFHPIEVPVRHRPRAAGRQSGGSLRVIFRAGGELMKLCFQARREKAG